MEERSRDNGKFDFVDRKSRIGLAALLGLFLFGLWCAIDGRVHPVQEKEISGKEMMEEFRKGSGIGLLDSLVRSADSLGTKETMEANENADE